MPAQFMQTHRSTFNSWVDDAFNNLIPIKEKKDLKKLPTSYGYYVILCDKPVPQTAWTYTNSVQVPYKGNFLWRDGAGDIRSTMSSRHLFRSLKARRNGASSNSMKVTLTPIHNLTNFSHCLLYTSPSPRDRTRSRMPSSA